MTTVEHETITGQTTTVEHETIPPEICDYWWPEHTQLPETDGSFAQNFQEHPQSILLTDSITPVLQQLHPDGQYAIGQDSGIYWNVNEVQTDTPIRGAVAPDWFYVPNVPPLLDGQFRRSYVMWKEIIPPVIVIEVVSGDGSEERDRTPITGKFWIYEHFIRPLFYAIYECKQASVDVYRMVDGRYELAEANATGRVAIAPMGVALGIWHGRYMQMEAPWLRWWDAQGNLLLTGAERAEQERRDKEQALTQLEQERERATRLAQKLHEMGIELE